MYAIVWEFRVREGAENQFIAGYGPDGDWARFFRQSAGYVRTELARSTSDLEIFFTFDFWQSDLEFEIFRELHGAAYDELDKKFAELTRKERRIGAFSVDAAEM